MQIHTIDAESEILNVVSSMDLRPESWKGWMALHIEAGEFLSDDEFIEAVSPIKAIIGSYLRSIEGGAFFCDNKYIYLVCKGPQKEILQQTAMQISELVFEEIYLSCHCRIYDLSTEALEFAERVIEEVGKISSAFAFKQEILAKETTDIQQRFEKDISNLKVLLVEDDAVIRWLIRNTLKDECDFATAPTAGNVFTIYPSFQPDIVFLDIGLPDNNGKKILEWIVGNDPKACVVMLSGKDNLENITECIGKGAKGFIAKPFVKENLLQYIRVYTGVKQQAS